MSTPSHRFAIKISVLFCLLVSWVSLSFAGVTVVTFSTTQLNFLQSSFLVNTQDSAVQSIVTYFYPQTQVGTWNYTSTDGSINTDGDMHLEICTASNGAEGDITCYGDSPFLPELMNATSGDVSHINSLAIHTSMTSWDGIIRFRSEHDCSGTGELHLEIHPVTRLYAWNGSSYALDSDYYSHFSTVPYGEGRTVSFYTEQFYDVETVTRPSADSVTLSLYEPAGNYVQYTTGEVTQGITQDSAGYYFMYHPTNPVCSGVTTRVRILPGTFAYNMAVSSTLSAGDTCLVNALTRQDFVTVYNIGTSLTVGASTTIRVGALIELIGLGISNIQKGPATPVQLWQFMTISNKSKEMKEPEKQVQVFSP